MGENRTLKRKKQGGDMQDKEAKVGEQQGKLVVIEGIDGSGKATQTKLLVERLRAEGYEVETIDFPQYGSKSAGPLEEYLNGKYGSSEEVGPWIASMFYAFDRYDASFRMREWLKSGAIVVSDRYVAANIGHQGGKIIDKAERQRYVQWLHDLEYGLFGIPEPNITFILKTSPELSRELAPQIQDREKLTKRRAYLGDRVRDIHEKDLVHLAQALESYLEAAEEFPEQFYVVECLDEQGKLKNREAIHEIIWERVSSELAKSDKD
jgi:dTMP kinase